MLHGSGLEDEAKLVHSKHPAIPTSEPSIVSPPSRPESRSSRPASRNHRAAKSPGAVTPARLGVVTENASTLSSDDLTTTSPIREGLGSLNRWSQSTTSSKSTSDYIGHRRGSSKRSTSGHSHRQGPGLGELPELVLPELRASKMFSADTTFSEMDSGSTMPNYHLQNQTDEIDEVAYPPAHNGVRNLEDISSPANGEDDADRLHGQSQKAMLSKALQKANTAVLLDNAANFEGAMEAYTDACQLLQLVMLRSNGGDEERLKLQEIVGSHISFLGHAAEADFSQRDTYMIRISELQRMDFAISENANKALPERPLSQESYGELLQSSSNGGTWADSQQSSTRPSPGPQTATEIARSLPSESIPPRHQSLRPSDQSGRSTPANSGAKSSQNGQYTDSLAQEANDSTSWLDTIDESGASSPSSANSKASSVYLRRRTSRRVSTDTEAEFDAALDAAVEAAYDDGLETVMEYREEESDDIVANARRNIELAKQRVREAEREAQVAMNRGREIRRIQEQNLLEKPIGRRPEYLDEEAEEEERLLEEMTRGYVMDDFEFGLQSKSALPRESDSSNMSGRTWESSAASNITSTGATLSTLTEDEDILRSDHKADQAGLSSSPPSAALPSIPASSDFPDLPAQRISLAGPPPPPAIGPPPVPGVRARRLSGQASAELTIDTNTRPRAESSASDSSFSTPLTSRPPPPLPKDEPSSIQRQSSTPIFQTNLNSSKRNPSVGSVKDHLNLAKLRTRDDDESGAPPLPSSGRPMGKIPSAPDGLDQIGSASKIIRARNVSVPNPETAPTSPTTPWSGSFPALDSQKTAMAGSIPVMPTPSGTHFTPNGLPTSGLNLFDCSIHSATTLGRPNSMLSNAPLPLEPCPESFLLRPFWLMRCLYQTIAHPHGGYLSAKLFIPRDVWRVKNVKLKAVEDKVSNCDLLTAALLKLAQVDTYDADAVLEEMQSLESVLDQVQATLSKKLGHEVGVHAAMPLFKPNASPEDISHVDPAPSRTSGTSNKSYLPTWKRLRAKTSGIGTTASTNPSAARESNKDNLTLNSVPMTSGPTTHPKRNVTQLEFSGPNAHYMGALARLFDAAQVIGRCFRSIISRINRC